jgi:hypothetical protein
VWIIWLSQAAVAVVVELMQVVVVGLAVLELVLAFL